MREQVMAQMRPQPVQVQSTAHGVLQRCSNGVECAECKAKREQREGTLQRAAVNATPASANGVPPVVHTVLNTSGHSLDSGTRSFMEPRFGHDFSSVRVHTDSRAADSARSVNALAYTVGRDIVFGTGQYRPGTMSGKRLLAHELTHVVQQNKGVAPQKIPETLEMSLPGDATEQEAEHVANAVMDAQSFTPVARTIDTVAMQKQDAGAANPDAGQSAPANRDAGAGATEGKAGQPQAAQPQSPEEQPEAKEGSASSQLPSCEPKALSRKDYLASSGTTQGDFGLTQLSGNGIFPTLHVTPVKGGVKVDPTDAGLPPITSVYTGAGIFTEDKGLYIAQQGDAGCKTGKYDIRWIIGQEGADTIAKGEKEHCEDFFYAFNTSIRLYADVVNQLSASNRVFQSQRQVENIVTRRVGVAPGKWQSVFKCLAAKTKQRDDLKWHTPRPLKREPNFSTNCAYIQYIVAKSSFSEISKHPSSEIIKDCGK